MPRKETPLLSEAVAEYLEVRVTYLARNAYVRERERVGRRVAVEGGRCNQPV